MNAEQKTSYLAAKTLLLTFILMVITVLLMATNLTSSARQEKRVFENAIPDRVPIKIKINTQKKEAFEDLKNEKWLSDFELELTNTGDKPIYFLSITMVTDVKHYGQRLVFPLSYGRAELGDIVSKARSDDIPIKPGETFVLKLSEWPEWERGVRENRWPQATKFRAELQSISFGDGTGYFANRPYPPADKRPSGRNDQVQPPNRTRAGPDRQLTGKLSTKQKISKPKDKPTSLLSAKFLSSERSNNHALTVEPQPTSCLFSECVTVIPWRGYVCWDNQARPECTTQNRPTLSPDGVCTELVYDKVICVAGSVEYYCQTITLYECGLGPGPTPTPTPTPAQCQYCNDPNALHPADCSNPSQPKCDSLLNEYQAVENLREALELHFTPPVATIIPHLRNIEVDIKAA